MFQTAHRNEATLTTGTYLVRQRARGNPRPAAVIVGASHLWTRFLVDYPVVRFGQPQLFIAVAFQVEAKVVARFVVKTAGI
jgi:hypothetical protein